jgi:polyphosphate kinase 2 (PPK2 family)
VRRKVIPARGMIGIFNRSYYEEVLAVRVHPEFLEKQKIPKDSLDKDIWEQRFREINNFERYLRLNRVIIINFFLNLSKKE